jgi:hypothetical protein
MPRRPDASASSGAGRPLLKRPLLKRLRLKRPLLKRLRMTTTTTR